MRDLTTLLHPVPELLDPDDAERQDAIRRKAALAVATHSENAQDCASLLEMLGLHTPADSHSEVA